MKGIINLKSLVALPTFVVLVLFMVTSRPTLVELFALTGIRLMIFWFGRTNETDSASAFVRVSVVHSKWLASLGEAVGWAYFVAWSVSFYPQIYENWKRKR
jgi:hypothetical protein